MSVFKNAKWIWVEKDGKADTYGEFYNEFQGNGGRTVCRISCDGDYTLFINGKYVSSNQYGDYEHYKIYDEIDVTPYLQIGKNKIAVLVWYFGVDTQRYKKARAGLIFELEEDGVIRAESDTRTLCRYSLAYKNGYCKMITPQLGYSYLYDSTKEDGWKNGTGVGFHESVVVDKNCSLVVRPIKRLILLAPKYAKLLSNKKNKSFVLDLGEETVGLASLSFVSKTEQKITVSFGENLKNGLVRRFVGERDFSFEYIAKTGKNEYINYMLRLGCRYLQIDCENEIDLEDIEVIPQVYSVQEKEITLENPLDKRIYDLCVNTLKLCMMEHYVDCPWREQCLYAFDSRNQMLCGYYAFEDKNVAYAHANLLLISKDKYPSGLTSICYPSGIDLTIPSFSLYYTLAVLEYIENTGDFSLAKEVYPRICEYTDVFMRERKNGLIYRFQGKNNWNFYDWSKGLDGNLFGEEENIADAPLNLLAILSLQSLRKICDLTGLYYPYGNVEKELTKEVYNTFYNAEKGVFGIKNKSDEYVELVNALAVICGVVVENESKIICDKLIGNQLAPCSLSMKGFIYDALIKTDKENYSEWILEDIRKTYTIMLEEGATATWETIDGAKAFDNAGSLCHGWSALPVYYYHIINQFK